MKPQRLLDKHGGRAKGPTVKDTGWGQARLPTSIWKEPHLSQTNSCLSPAFVKRLTFRGQQRHLSCPAPPSHLWHFCPPTNHIYWAPTNRHTLVYKMIYWLRRFLSLWVNFTQSIEVRTRVAEEHGGRGHRDLGLGVWGVGSSPGSSTLGLCDLGQITWPSVLGKVMPPTKLVQC